MSEKKLLSLQNFLKQLNLGVAFKMKNNIGRTL
jgi:hypothetical protein